MARLSMCSGGSRASIPEQGAHRCPAKIRESIPARRARCPGAVAQPALFMTLFMRTNETLHPSAASRTWCIHVLFADVVTLGLRYGVGSGPTFTTEDVVNGRALLPSQPFSAARPPVLAEQPLRELKRGPLGVLRQLATESLGQFVLARHGHAVLHGHEQRARKRCKGQVRRRERIAGQIARAARKALLHALERRDNSLARAGRTAVINAHGAPHERHHHVVAQLHHQRFPTRRVRCDVVREVPEARQQVVVRQAPRVGAVLLVKEVLQLQHVLSQRLVTRIQRPTAGVRIQVQEDVGGICEHAVIRDEDRRGASANTTGGTHVEEGKVAFLVVGDAVEVQTPACLFAVVADGNGDESRAFHAVPPSCVRTPGRAVRARSSAGAPPSRPAPAGASLTVRVQTAPPRPCRRRCTW